MNFEEAKKELLRIAEGRYIAINRETFVHSDSDERTDCIVYVDGFGHHTAPTWVEALASMQKAIRRDTNEDNQQA